MGLSIHLLGPPRMERGGVAVDPPRGHKAWGLLVYLVRTRVAPSRERLAGLLFPEADDPLGALRWTLSALRRRLGNVELGGDPVRLALPSGTFVDVEVLSTASWPEAVAIPGLGHELLDGLAFRSSPGFEMWLENERRHIAGTTSAVLHQAALAQLARGEVVEAVQYASRLRERGGAGAGRSRRGGACGRGGRVRSPEAARRRCGRPERRRPRAPGAGTGRPGRRFGPRPCPRR